jgi:hypothetical protein
MASAMTIKSPCRRVYAANDSRLLFRPIARQASPESFARRMRLIWKRSSKTIARTQAHLGWAPKLWTRSEYQAQGRRRARFGIRYLRASAMTYRRQGSSAAIRHWSRSIPDAFAWFARPKLLRRAGCRGEDWLLRPNVLVAALGGDPRSPTGTYG